MTGHHFSPQRIPGVALAWRLALILFFAGCVSFAVFAQDPGAEGAAKPEPAAPEEPLPAADFVVERMIAAEGGREAMGKVRSRIIHGELEVIGMGMSATFTSWNDGKGGYRESMTIPGNPEGTPGMEFDQGYIGGVAWGLDTLQGARLLDGVEKEMRRRSSHLHLLLAIGEDYQKVECVGRKVIRERPCYEMRMTPQLGNAETWFVDAESFLGVRTEMTVEAPMIGKIKMALGATDYREVDGLHLPHRMELEQGPARLILTVKSYEHNAEIPAETFQLPAAVQELIDKQKAKEATGATGEGAKPGDASAEPQKPGDAPAEPPKPEEPKPAPPKPPGE